MPQATGNGQREHCCEPEIPASRLAREPWETPLHEYLDRVRDVPERYQISRVGFSAIALSELPPFSELNYNDPHTLRDLNTWSPGSNTI